MTFTEIIKFMLDNDFELTDSIPITVQGCYKDINTDNLELEINDEFINESKTKIFLFVSMPEENKESE